MTIAQTWSAPYPKTQIALMTIATRYESALIHARIAAHFYLAGTAPTPQTLFIFLEAARPVPRTLAQKIAKYVLMKSPTAHATTRTIVCFSHDRATHVPHFTARMNASSPSRLNRAHVLIRIYVFTGVETASQTHTTNVYPQENLDLNHKTLFMVESRQSYVNSSNSLVPSPLVNKTTPRSSSEPIFKQGRKYNRGYRGIFQW